MSVSRNRNTVYDDAFRTVEQECADALIYFVNQVFGRNYGQTAVVELLRNEHYVQNKGEDTEKRISDSHFSITAGEDTDYFHLECESSGYDESLLIRIFQYGINHAIKDSEGVHDKLTVSMPASGLVVLRDRGNPPEHATFEIVTSGGRISYEVPVICMRDYTLDDLFDRRLYFLLPFYFFNLESRLDDYNNDRQGLREFEDVFLDIVERLRNTCEAVLSLRSKGVIIKEMGNVVRKLAYGKRRVVRKVGDIMGGKPHKLEWLERFDAAVAEGKEEGKAEGKVEGRTEDVTDMLKRGKTVEEIVEFCGYDADFVRKVEESLLVSA